MTSYRLCYAKNFFNLSVPYLTIVPFLKKSLSILGPIPNSFSFKTGSDHNISYKIYYVYYYSIIYGSYTNWIGLSIFSISSRLYNLEPIPLCTQNILLSITAAKGK